MKGIKERNKEKKRREGEKEGYRRREMKGGSGIRGKMKRNFMIIGDGEEERIK